MSRHLLLVLALIACSSKPQVSKETPRATPDVATASAGAPPAAAVPPPDPREAALSAAVVRLLEHGHLLRRPIDDEVSRLAFDNYLDRLDGSKMFLLRGDRDALKAHADQIDDQLRAGTLELAHAGAKIFAARVVQVDGFVAALLAAPFNHDDEEWIELDPKKVEPAATEDELRERWRRRLEVEVLERVAAMEARLEPPKPEPKRKPGAVRRAPPPPPPADKTPIPPTWEGREAKARADLAKQYAGRFARLRAPAPLDAAADVVNAVASVLDPHTTYLPPADKANFDIQMSGSLEGIGAVLRERDHYIEIMEIVPGGASARQGLLSAGDLILSVASDGGEPVDTYDMRIDEVVKMIRGPKGTTVRLRIQKASGAQETIEIVRDVVVVEETYARGAVLSRKPGQPSYGYIQLPSFYGGKGAPRTAAGDVRRLLRELAARKVAGVVIDLRSNGGGLLGDAVEMTGHLIDEGPVVQVQDGRGKAEVLADDEPGTEYDGKVVVLVDRFAASASEIVAGALQDYGRAIIVGTGPTHGKGTVQTLADLDRTTGGQIELGSLKVTIQQFFRVSGSSTQREGVIPDIVLPDPAAHVESGERELDHAIAWSQIAPAPHKKLAPSWKMGELTQKSAVRVAKHPVLAKVATTTQALKARRNDTRVPLARAAWDARRKEHRAAAEAASLDQQDMPPALTVKLLDEPAAAAAAAPAPANGTAPEDRLGRWRDNLSRDPWVEECLHILADAK
ncbi:MAG TPA: carboxy terminal-processing peptidase [Kofleriaceae bacterium]|nr:carboxy terminal-processing peptidase [Kofleriaceae bacterium]